MDTVNYRQEAIKPYADGGAKAEQVERMFDRIAPTYDLLNHGLSLGIDKRWRRAAIDSLRPHTPQRILDVATGTGDFALLAARELHPEQLLGVDLSEGMMQVGREKVAKAGLQGVISFRREDCLALNLPDGSFDAVTVAYGIRNFADLDRGLREMLRVLRPGGRLVIIELTAPRRFPMRQLFWLYSHLLMPVLGRLVSRDGSAYKYLPATMEAFPQGEQMQGILRRAGFTDVRFRRFTFGLSTLYTAAAPGGAPSGPELYGLIGYPLAHSFSAQYFSEKFAQEGRDAAYTNFPLEHVPDLHAFAAEHPRLRGLNVTIPHKQAAIPQLDALSPEAEAIGAVNVIKVERSGGTAADAGGVRLVGYDTDVVGFRESLEPLLTGGERRALVLGTGGAACAVAHGLRELGIAVQLVSRTRRGDGSISYADITPEVLAGHLLVVNCSPVGMHPHTEDAPAIPYAALTPRHLLYDLVYNPPETTFLRRGREQGARTKNGLEMLHRQAEAAWRIWNG